jgi:hypothetical protein
MAADTSWIPLICLSALMSLPGFINGVMGPVITDLIPAFGGLSHGVAGLIFVLFFLGSFLADVSTIVLEIQLQSSKGGIPKRCLAVLQPANRDRRYILYSLYINLISLLCLSVAPDYLYSSGFAYAIFLISILALGFGSDFLGVYTGYGGVLLQQLDYP